MDLTSSAVTDGDSGGRYYVRADFLEGDERLVSFVHYIPSTASETRNDPPISFSGTQTGRARQDLRGVRPILCRAEIWRGNSGLTRVDGDPVSSVEGLRSAPAYSGITRR